MDQLFVMDHIFEPGLLDPSPLDFLSFSSISSALSPLSSAWSPSSPSPANAGRHADCLTERSSKRSETRPTNISTPSSRADSETSSPSPVDPFLIISDSYRPFSPAPGDFGIFHTPSKAGPSRPKQPRTAHSTAAVLAATPSTPSPSYGHRGSTSSGDWSSPVTPSLAKASGDHFAAAYAAAATSDILPPPKDTFSWDDAPLSLGASSSSYTSTLTPTQPIVHQALRVASNPTLGAAAKNPRAVKLVTSMPALREEDQSSIPITPSAWLDDSALLDASPSDPAPAPAGSTDEPLTAEDFNWMLQYGVNPGLGLGESHEDTIFSAFHEATGDPVPALSADTSPIIDVDLGVSVDPVTGDMGWLFDPSAQDVGGTGNLSYNITSMKDLTINPLDVMAAHGGLEEDQRPNSAPGADVSAALLSVPAGDSMARSLTADGLVPSRHAPNRSDLFSYQPQQIPTGPPAPQPLYTTDPSPSYNPMGPQHFPRQVPLTPRSRRSSQNVALSVKIQPPPHSTYLACSPLPPTPPISATFGDMQAQQASAPMSRVSSQPLPHTRRMSGSYPMSNRVVPAHMARAQAYAQMQEVNEEAVRHDFMRQVSGQQRYLGSVSMQPSLTCPPTASMGWEAFSAGTPSPYLAPQQPIMHPQTVPMLTTHTPLMTVHPPPPPPHHYYPAPPRIHPPPHPGHMAHRPIARLPSPKSRKVSPTKRSPSGKKRGAPSGGAFSWGETTFINFTSDDAEKLLTGVAPSGSQSKRKREEEAARAAAAGMEYADVGARKRSKSDE